MNKTFTRFFAGALAAASLFALASCGEKKDGDDKSANASTPAPITEAPSVTDEPTATLTKAPTPTPEPTATPIPNDWYIDTRGDIPPEVEVVSQQMSFRDNGYCISSKEGKYYFQIWSDMELISEYEVPAFLASFERLRYDRIADSPYILLLYDKTSDDKVKAFCWIGLNGKTFALSVKDYSYNGSEHIAHVFITEDDRVICFDGWNEKCWQMEDVGRTVRFANDRYGLTDETGAVIIEAFDYFKPNGETAQTQPGEPIWERIELED